MFCFWHIFFWCKSTTPSASTVLAQDLIPNQALKIILKIWTHWGYKFILKKNYLDVQGWTQMNSRVTFKTGCNWVKSTGAQSFIGSPWVKIMIGCHINLHIISWRYEFHYHAKVLHIYFIKTVDILFSLRKGSVQFHILVICRQSKQLFSK